MSRINKIRNTQKPKKVIINKKKLKIFKQNEILSMCNRIKSETSSSIQKLINL